MRLFLVWLRTKKAIPAITARPRTPPTTPPAMAPAWFEEEGLGEGDDEERAGDGAVLEWTFAAPEVEWLGEEVGFAVGEGEAGADDSGPSPIVWAWIGLKDLLVVTSI